MGVGDGGGCKEGPGRERWGVEEGVGQSVKPRLLGSDWQPVTYLRDKALQRGGSGPVIPIAVTIVTILGSSSSPPLLSISILLLASSLSLLYFFPLSLCF